MARIRTIKPEFWTSEQITECSPSARLLFIGLWNFCDDSGIHPANSKRLLMEVFPAGDFTRIEVDGFIGELIQHGLLTQYSVEDTQYWIVTGFTKHQKIDQPTHRFPHPDGVIPANARRLNSANKGSNSSNNRRALGEHSPPEGKGKEGKGNKRARFTPPSLSDVQGFIAEKGYLHVNANSFIAHYEANGWMVGKNKMKCWKSALSGWEARAKEKHPSSQDNELQQRIRRAL